MSLTLHLLLAELIRVIFILYGSWHDENMEVKYTDIDYNVFTDASIYVANGSSPFLRHTYRYTPLLALLLTPNILLTKLFGKILFSLFDVLTGYMIYKSAEMQTSKIKPIICACLWLYNPMCIVICTRGNAECIMTGLTIFFTFCLLQKKYMLAAIIYGFSIHFKIYPAIYAPTIILHLSEKTSNLKEISLILIKPNKNLVKFCFVSAITFAIPTYLSYYFYGQDYLNEAIFHHFNRKDIRHNFSPYNYLLYLSDELKSELLALIVFLPQIVLLIAFALKFHKANDLPFNFFASTFIFVMFNKVCTSQYFLWFLCYLPLIIPKLIITKKRTVCLIALWLLGQAIFLCLAYLLEIQGINVFLYLWISTITFFSINLYILNEIAHALYTFKKLA